MRQLTAAVLLLLTGCDGEIVAGGDGRGAQVGPRSDSPGTSTPVVPGVPGVMMPGTAGGPGGSGGGEALPQGPMVAGRVTLHRLNNAELDNTARDLLGVDLKPSVTFQFPPDEFGEGFDNNADVLTLAPLKVEKYLAMARALAAAALDPAGTARARVLVCTSPAEAEATCLPKIAAAFASRAFRRPVVSSEVADLVGAALSARQQGATFERAVQVLLEGVFLSPEFLFRVEVDPAGGAAHPLAPYELASRLSYFLWGTMPDDALLAAAGQGALGTDAQVLAQVRRMLADPKAAALGATLSAQWMQSLALADAAPDAALFPGFDAALRDAMAEETRRTFEEILKGEVDAKTLLVSDHVFVNARLAQHYGLTPSPAPGAAFVKAPAGARRGGVLTTATFLTINAHAKTNSPTRRGKWILERVLCEAPPPPPANVPLLDPASVPTGSLRQKLEQVHQARGAACTGCHQSFDPLGFALEHYGPTGQWRDTDDGYAIDATGTLKGTTTTFDGALSLARVLAEDPRFPRCMAKKLMTFALGRGLTAADGPALDAVTAKFAGQGLRFPALIEAVATSVPFTQRQGEVTP
ncbi:MAG: DUF1592 domain-containing protein [Myxococcaceae bacterium]|nr:DUF1592 domain-containing protein [Myxococcaceae bacterium]